MKVRKTALRELRKPFEAHLLLLIKWYIISRDHPVDSPPNSYEDIFDGDYINTVHYLDFNENQSYTTQTKWFQYSSRHTSEFRDKIELLTPKYGYYMDSEMISTVQELSNSVLVETMMHIEDIVDEHVQENRMWNEDIFEDYNLFNAIAMDSVVEDHLNSVLSVIDLYEDTPDVEIQLVDSFHQWDENLTPVYGSARIEKSIESTKPMDVFDILPYPS